MIAWRRARKNDIPASRARPLGYGRQKEREAEAAGITISPCRFSRAQIDQVGALDAGGKCCHKSRSDNKKDARRCLIAG